MSLKGNEETSLTVYGLEHLRRRDVVDDISNDSRIPILPGIDGSCPLPVKYVFNKNTSVLFKSLKLMVSFGQVPKRIRSATVDTLLQNPRSHRHFYFLQLVSEFIIIWSQSLLLVFEEPGR